MAKDKKKCLYGIFIKHLCEKIDLSEAMMVLTYARMVEYVRDLNTPRQSDPESVGTEVMES